MENGLEARLKVLEEHKAATNARLRNIEGKLDKIMGIGWAILGSLVSGILLWLVKGSQG